MSVGRENATENEKAVKEKKIQLLQSELDKVIPKLWAATGDVCVELFVWQLERRHSYTGSMSLGREDCLVETESFNIIGKWMPRWYHILFCESNSRSVEKSKDSSKTTVFYFPGWVWLTGAYFSVVTKPPDCPVCGNCCKAETDLQGLLWDLRSNAQDPSSRCE